MVPMNSETTHTKNNALESENYKENINDNEMKS